MNRNGSSLGTSHLTLGGFYNYGREHRASLSQLAVGIAWDYLAADSAPQDRETDPCAAIAPVGPARSFRIVTSCRMTILEIRSRGIEGSSPLGTGGAQAVWLWTAARTPPFASSADVGFSQHHRCHAATETLGSCGELAGRGSRWHNVGGRPYIRTPPTA